MPTWRPLKLPFRPKDLPQPERERLRINIAAKRIVGTKIPF
jgi:hypothetical protein